MVSPAARGDVARRAMEARRAHATEAMKKISYKRRFGHGPRDPPLVRATSRVFHDRRALAAGGWVRDPRALRRAGTTGPVTVRVPRGQRPLKYIVSPSGQKLRLVA